MSTTLLAPQLQDGSDGASIQQQVATMIDDLIAQLPNPEQLTDEERRGIIARYTAVLEGNFIYWMTATFLATHSGGGAADHWSTILPWKKSATAIL